MIKALNKKKLRRENLAGNQIERKVVLSKRGRNMEPQEGNNRRSKANNNDRMCTDVDEQLAKDLQDKEESINLDIDSILSPEISQSCDQLFTWRCELERWRLRWLQRDNHLFQVQGR